MEIKGKAYCFFEQSGTFKREFIKLGIPAEDYDIQNEFGETDHVVDLFQEIERGYDGEPSVWDKITPDDFVMAFFPCIYFSTMSQAQLSFTAKNYVNLTLKETTDKILERCRNRERFFALAVKMTSIAKQRGIRLVMENPWSQPTYLANFTAPPSLIDHNRMIRGDYFVKPTAYWFYNCEPTHGVTIQNNKERKVVTRSECSGQAGICSTERSMISPDYARNFICDFLLAKPQKYSIQDMFEQ